MYALGWIVTLLMLLALFLIPLGLPGLWIMVALVAVGAFMNEVSAGVLFVVVAAAAVSELLEFLIIKRFSSRYGGTSAAFWGAVIGGFLGVLIGLPIPVIGPLLAGIVGSFIGATAAAFHGSRDLLAAGRVGWGVVLARLVAAVAKVGAAILILVVGGTAWMIR